MDLTPAREQEFLLDRIAQTTAPTNAIRIDPVQRAEARRSTTSLRR